MLFVVYDLFLVFDFLLQELEPFLYYTVFPWCCSLLPCQTWFIAVCLCRIGAPGSGIASHRMTIPLDQAMFCA